ncbi:MAG TPA: RcpC/CpaB family pilus assembly protein [Acidimicrobiales bacterium]|nr:RcpC/CpaB family pilus assembly protein [Acidimicrobiales bacterium]
MIKRQKLIGVIASVVLAAIGTALLVAYVRSAEENASERQKTAGVLVVTDKITQGTKAEDMAAKVKTQMVPVNVMALGAVGDVSALAGRVADVDLLPGEQLVQSRFVTGAEAGKRTVPPGALKVTVLLEAVRAMGGQIHQGDSVGVLVSFEDPDTTHLILHKVPVTDVRTEADGGAPGSVDAKPTGKLFVTLAIDGPSVERVVFGAEHGTVWLSQEPIQADEGGTQVQTLGAVNA